MECTVTAQRPTPGVGCFEVADAASRGPSWESWEQKLFWCWNRAILGLVQGGHILPLDKPLFDLGICFFKISHYSILFRDIWWYLGICFSNIFPSVSNSRVVFRICQSFDMFECRQHTQTFHTLLPKLAWNHIHVFNSILILLVFFAYHISIFFDTNIHKS